MINGPRFSTRAESTWFRRAGWDVVNMTQYPEAYLARELGLCYAGLALVTDYDTGVEGDEAAADAGTQPVTMEAVLAVLADNVQRTRRLLFDAIPAIPAGFACTCAQGGAPSLRLERLGPRSAVRQDPGQCRRCLGRCGQRGAPSSAQIGQPGAGVRGVGVIRYRQGVHPGPAPAGGRRHLAGVITLVGHAVGEHDHVPPHGAGPGGLPQTHSQAERQVGGVAAPEIEEPGQHRGRSFGRIDGPQDHGAGPEGDHRQLVVGRAAAPPAPRRVIRAVASGAPVTDPDASMTRT